MNPTLKPEEYSVVDTRRIDITRLCQSIGFDKSQEAMKTIATLLTEAIQMTRGNRDIQIEYRNILERDSNPGGFLPFFEIIDMDGREKQEVNVIRITQAPGEPVSIG